MSAPAAPLTPTKVGMSGGAKFGITLLVLIILAGIAVGIYFGVKKSSAAAAANAAAAKGTPIPANGLTLATGVTYTGGILATSVPLPMGSPPTSALIAQLTTYPCTLLGKVSMASTGVSFGFTMQQHQQATGYLITVFMTFTVANGSISRSVSLPSGMSLPSGIPLPDIPSPYIYPGAASDIVAVAASYHESYVSLYVNGTEVPSQRFSLNTLGIDNTLPFGYIQGFWNLQAISDTVSNLTWDAASA
jgi:hypothetical protein